MDKYKRTCWLNQQIMCELCMNHSTKTKHLPLGFGVGRSYSNGRDQEERKSLSNLLELEIENKTNQITSL